MSSQLEEGGHLSRSEGIFCGVWIGAETERDKSRVISLSGKQELLDREVVSV